MKVINKIGAIIVTGKHILVVRKKNPDNRKEFIIPGGKIESGESDFECLSRELSEEISVRLINTEYFGDYNDTAVFENIPIYVRAYIVEIEGQPKPNSEIKEYLWVDRNYRENGIILGSILSEHIIPQLIEKGVM